MIDNCIVALLVWGGATTSSWASNVTSKNQQSAWVSKDIQFYTASSSHHEWGGLSHLVLIYSANSSEVHEKPMLYTVNSLALRSANDQRHEQLAISSEVACRTY